ncbi:MAG: hypothetical protein ACYS67_08785 [Planctomycetota bacterium]
MKSAKTILIMAAVLFAALSLSSVSAEREPETTEPARVVRTPARPPSASEEEAPRTRPVTRTPARRTPTRTPVRAVPTRPATRPGAIRPTPTRRARPPEDPHKNSIIHVEAFLVEVRLSVLHSQGVPQISEECKSISAEQIIKLMKTTDATVVTAGAKLAVSQKSNAETKSSTRRPILSGPPEQRRTEYVEVSTNFSAFAIIGPSQKIFLDIGFEHNTIDEGDGDDKTGEAVFVEREWTSTIPLQDGKATIVGAIQEKEEAVFLIVTAHIKD